MSYGVVNTPTRYLNPRVTLNTKDGPVSGVPVGLGWSPKGARRAYLILVVPGDFRTITFEETKPDSNVWKRITR